MSSAVNVVKRRKSKWQGHYLGVEKQPERYYNNGDQVLRIPC